MGQTQVRAGAGSTSLTGVARDAVAFDTSGLAPIAGLRAAAGLAATLVIGLAAGGPTAAVIAASGALIIGIVSLTGGVRPPLLTMTLTALAQAASIFVGSATGQTWLLHLAILVLWSFIGALVVALGGGATTVGLQAIVAFVIFGRFTATPAGAAQLAGIALSGAALQIVLIGVVRWPEALGAQRRQLGVAFAALAGLARGAPDASSLPAAQAADAAQLLLSGTSLLARDDGRAMRGLLDEARRIRLALLSLSGLRRRMPSTRVAADVDALLGDIATVLDQVAVALTVRDGRALQRLRGQTDRLSEAARALRPDRDGDSPVARAATDVLAALAGQLRAVVALIEEIRQSGGTRLRLPRRLQHRDRHWLDRVQAQLALLAANLTPHSAAFRHATRMAVLVPVASVLSQHTPLVRSYWIPLTVAVVLRPDFSGTVTRGAGRMVGTSAGVAIAGVTVAALRPGQTVSIVAIWLLAWAAYTLFAASYAGFIACLTGIVVLLLGLITQDTIGTAVDRLVDTLIGGALALVAYAAWPTWSADEAWAALGNLVNQQRRYVRAVLDRIMGMSDVDEPTLAQLARQARLARSNATAVVDRSLHEPSRYRIDPQRTAGVLAALRRVNEAAHLLRTRTAGARLTAPSLPALADAIDEALATIAATLGDANTHRTLPPLRRLYDRLSAELAGREDDRVSDLLLTETDEVVDAIDTVGALVGVHAPAAA